VPVTGRGTVGAAAALQLRRMKRTIKQNEHLFRLAKKIRATLGQKARG
jgi:hypothetical protein